METPNESESSFIPSHCGGYDNDFDLYSEPCDDLKDFDYNSSEDESEHSDATYTKEHVTKSTLDVNDLCDRSYNRPKSSLSLRYDSYNSDIFEKRNNRRVRARSCEPKKRVTFEKTDEDEEIQDFLSAFQRSLKLLGLETNKSYTTCYKPTNNSISRRTPTPRLCTRLHERSLSLASLRQDDMYTMLRDRELLSKAVYEEWYFRKLMQERAARERERMKQKQQQEKSENVRQKAQLEFQRWCSRKREKVHELKSKKHDDTQIGLATTSNQEIRAKAESAFHQWLHQKRKAQMKSRKEKNKYLSENNEEQVQNSKKQQDSEKRAQAEASYRVWKQRADEAFQAKNKEEVMKKRQKAAKERKEKMEKAEAAQKAFSAWKALKDTEIKTQQERNRRRNRVKIQREQMRATERLYQAEQAFEDWLERVEHRKKFGRSGPVSPVPWNPGGGPIQLT
ncbi:protein maph-9-like isoform X1 [Schistocerca americana]|uniref:protein maph-9-like isoform X1 n=1 Tax=Schistocerca americana TaxID=7009 RepID=UPI001F4FEBA4|nr:protein maph-9-like isoform X1 [Schistocerca americana]